MAFVASSTLAWASGQTVSHVPVPAGAGVGHIVVVDLMCGWASGVVTPPAGFTLDSQVTFTGATLFFTYYRYWKRLNASESGTYNFTTAAVGTQASATLWSGRATSGSPFDTGTGTTSGVSAPTGAVDTPVACPNVPSITPSTSGVDLLYGVADWTNSIASATVTAGWTITAQAANGLNAYKTNQPASASGLVTITASTDRWTALLSALLPAVAGTSPTAYLSGQPAIMDSELLVDVTGAVNGSLQHVYVGLRTNGVFTSSGQPNYGYFLSLFGSTSTFTLNRNLAGVTTVLATGSLVEQTGVPLHIRFRCEDNWASARVWYGATEPGTWTAQIQDSVPNCYMTAGRVSLSCSVSGQQVTFDNLTVNNSSSWLSVPVWSGNTAVRLFITTPGRYNGGGQTVPGITITSDNVIVENFISSGAVYNAIKIVANNVTVQDCQFTQVSTGPDDLDSGRMWGNNIHILRNHTHDLISGVDTTSHRDFFQTYTVGGNPTTSNLIVAGNRVDGYQGPALATQQMHQGLMAEGPLSTGGGGGGTGDDLNWLVEDNYFDTYANQCLALRGIHNVVVRNNQFVGGNAKAVQIQDTTTVTLYDNNFLKPPMVLFGP